MIHASQLVWSAHEGWQPTTPDTPRPANLVLVFGAPAALENADALRELRARHPDALVVGASTAGEISSRGVTDDAMVATALSFEHTRVRAETEPVTGPADSYEAALRLGQRLDAVDLAHVLVLADGTNVNGTEIVRGLRNELPRTVAVTGGLAGDGPRFDRTLTLVGDRVESGKVVAVGFYGERLRVGYGSLGGWDPTGPMRRITRSEGNVLLEIDGKPALSVYRELLGAQAAQLPASGLLYPLLVQTPQADFVRTLIGVDAERDALRFAGDVPSGRSAYFMRANFDRLVMGAQGAAKDCLVGTGTPPRVAVLISCVGRKLVLGERTRDEVDAVAQVFGRDTLLTGFYSYGEICPVAPGANCALHNQTMTITTFDEA